MPADRVAIMRIMVGDKRRLSDDRDRLEALSHFVSGNSAFI